MGHIGWDPSLETGDWRVDAQHKSLFGLLDELHNAIVDQQGDDAVGGVVMRIMHYADTHFRDEETLMERYDYPGLPSHRLAHHDFKQEAKRLHREFTETGTVLPLALSMFLNDWLSRHIRTEDRRIVEHIESQKRAFALEHGAR